MPRVAQFLWLTLFAVLAAQAAAMPEVNYWPVFVDKRDEGVPFANWEAFGPLVFQKESEETEIWGIRPVFTAFHDRERDTYSRHFLYPVLNLREWPYGSSWDILTLIRYQSFSPDGGIGDRIFQFFPFVFWGKKTDPDDSWFGLFPIYGETRNFLTYNEIHWILFPLYARLVRDDTTTYAAPWPFVRFVRGPETRGFHLWPFYGKVERENYSSHVYWLWPLGYKVRRELWKEQPFEASGFLPFYASSRSDRAVSRTVLWPFFGYTASTNPQYFEKRYFWPFFVQRSGGSYINRWAPFYSRSVRSAVDLRWILWPFHRRAIWEEHGLLNERTQFLYFLYWSQVQSSVAQPELDPAIKQHVWPFYSYWDNGAGRKQLQALSPFEVFFPFNDVVRETWSPLFALYRFEAEENVGSRHAFLFNFITATSREEKQRFEFHVGPVFSYRRAAESKQWEILKGLVSFTRDSEGRSFGAFWFNRPKAPSSQIEAQRSGEESDE